MSQGFRRVGQGGGGGTGALERKGPQRWPQRRSGRRLEEVAKAVGGGYFRLQMPLKLGLGVRGTVAGHRLGALEGGGGYLRPFQCIPWGGGAETIFLCEIRLCPCEPATGGGGRSGVTSRPNSAGDRDALPSTGRRPRPLRRLAAPRRPPCPEAAGGRHSWSATPRSSA